MGMNWIKIVMLNMCLVCSIKQPTFYTKLVNISGITILYARVRYGFAQYYPSGKPRGQTAPYLVQQSPDHVSRPIQKEKRKRTTSQTRWAWIKHKKSLEISWKQSPTPLWNHSKSFTNGNNIFSDVFINNATIEKALEKIRVCWND